MQKDSVHFSTSGHMTLNQSVTEESRIKSFHCSQCTLIFKSKVYLFEHLNKVHNLDVNTALTEAGLKHNEGSKATTGDKSSNLGNDLLCHHCDFKACSQDVLNEHKQCCNNKLEDQKRLGNLTVSEEQETKINVISANQHKEVAETKESSSVKSTSKSKCTLDTSKDLKTYKRTLQTITKYFAEASGSQDKPSVKSAENPVLESTKGTLILQESPSSSSPNSSGVFKVTAKSMIDISNKGSGLFLLKDHLLVTDLAPTPNVEEQFKEATPNKAVKRTDSENSESCPAKKAKSSKRKTQPPEKATANTQQPSSNADFSFEISEDEEEKMPNLLNGDTESPKVYFCKHCDYSDVGIRCLSTHYKNDHPYIRYNVAYIQDPNNQAATFRCLECPVEFLTVTDLKRHYTENHPGAPKVFTKQAHELCLVFKCFVCPFTTNVLKPLKEHYKEKHPKHNLDNSLFYCRYSATRSQEESSQLNTCVKAHSPERSDRLSTQNEAVENSSSPLHPTSKGTDVVLYRCNNCKFSHKSVVVVHVHYQKSHPQEAITIDKIKQSAHDTSHVTSQIMPEKSVTVAENSRRTSQRAKNKTELLLKKNSFNLKHAPDASETHLESPKPEEVKTAEDRSKTKTPPTKCPSSPIKMFYCKICSYSSTNIRSVAAHHNVKHAVHGLTDTEEITLYSTEVQKKLRREAETSANTTADSKSSKQVVCSEKKYQQGGDDVEDASMKRASPFLHAENLFYCQKCNYGNATVRGILKHQTVVHQLANTSYECILGHTTLIRDEIQKSKSNTKESISATHLPLPLMNEGDENMFFCHLCNYRHRVLIAVLNHCFKRHREFQVKSKQINQYTSVVRKQAQNSHLKTNQEGNHASLGIQGNKDKKTTKVSVSPSSSVKQTQRKLKCHKCSFSSQYVNILRRHMWKSHRTNPSTSQVLKSCFKLGMLDAGYHCDLCVFSHKTAAAVYNHYQEQHPERKITLDHVSTRLHVGADPPRLHEKTHKTKYTHGISGGDGADGSSLSQRFGQTRNIRYSCRECSFRSHSMSTIARHLRIAHSRTVKEDGSVPNVITSQELSANRHVEDHNEMPESFDTHQVPLEFDKSPDSSHEATKLPTLFRCHYCPAEFQTKRGFKIHCGMKHQDAVTEKIDEQQVRIQTRVHVFKCPHCTYVNTNYQGVLTHCQMRHPTFVARADSLHVDKTDFLGFDESLKREGPGDRFRGYMCQTCPQIYATLEMLKKHCENDHNEAVLNAVTDTLKPAPQPSAVGKIQKSNTRNSHGSVSKPSFVRKNIYAVVRCQHCSYKCSTKIGLIQHLHVHHRNASVPKVKDCEYKCVLCSRSYFRKKRLGSHYITKHGKDAYSKYYARISQPVPENSALVSPDCPLTQQPKTTSEVLASSTVAQSKHNKILVYRCPQCPYMNASYHGTLTHCQMKHPTLVARADELKTDEILVTNMVGCTMGKGSNERGYMCKKCPQIFASLMKLKIHCQKDHDQAEPTASEHSADAEPEKQPDHSSEGSALEAASLQNKISAVTTTDTDPSQQVGSPETCQVSMQSKELLYKCHMCAYRGICRKYLHCHYRKTHKLDSFSTYKLLEKYNKHKSKLSISLANNASEERTQSKSKNCPNLTFDSSQLLIDHYSTFHSSHCKLDFTVLSQRTKKSTGVYKCGHCNKHIYGMRNLCRHLDRHSAREQKKAMAAKAPLVISTKPEATSNELCRQDEVPILETVEELTQWNVTPVETFTLPASPLSSHSNPTDQAQPQLKSRVDKHSCKQCGRTFMSLKGLRSHEHSHAALAAIKKQNNLPASVLKHNLKKYVVYKSGVLKPFRCSFCSYRTTVLGLWKSHFMKKHHDVVMDPAETDNQDEDNFPPPNSSENKNHLAEPDEEPDIVEESMYLEPPDVQRQLNHYSLMAQSGVLSNVNLQETELPVTSLLHCEFCNFSTGHLSSMRRHYINRHGKKILRCKDCDFFTGVRKTLEMHMERGHSTCQSEHTHQKDFHCPFCLYQTKNKKNMIDHIILHREERVVPIEVRRPKLSRYLQGVVFRCHKCTFTSGSAENLRLHMMRHDDIRPYKCRLCYFDCTQLSDLEAHLSDKHQVLRNHELVGHVSLEQLEARVGRIPAEEKEPSLNPEHHTDVETEETLAENPAESNITKKIVTLPDTVRKTKDKVEQNVGRGNNADIQFEECNGPGREWTTNENQARPKGRGSEKSDKIMTQQKKEVAEGSKTEPPRLKFKALQHRTLNIETRVEDDILCRILELDKDDNISRTLLKTGRDRAVKTEQNTATAFGNNALSELPVEEGGIALKHHTQASNSRRKESFEVERQSPTLLPIYAQLKISNEESSTVFLPNCKEEVCNRRNSEEATDPYGEMPVLENENLKAVSHLLGCCKEEEENELLEQKQDKKEKELINEDNDNRCKDRQHKEGKGINEADSPLADRSAFTATGGAAEVPHPSATEKKLYTCDLCGRNLTNSTELKCHIMRHGM